MTAILNPRVAWLAERRKLVTASDAAAILGADPRRGPLAVYAEKLGAEIPETLPMRRGKRWEQVIADEYGEQTGRRVEAVGEYVIQHHPDIPWLGATLDRVTGPYGYGDGSPDPFGGNSSGTLELKMALGSARAWKADPPLGFLVQVHIQIACFNATWGALAGLTGPGPLNVSDHKRNDAFLAAALPHLEAFWLRVQRRDPPPADASPGTTAAIKALWSDEDGSTVALDMEAQALVLAMELGQAEARKRAAELLRIKNELRRRVGSASFGALPDGSFLSAHVTRRASYTVAACTYRVLRRWWPHRRRQR